MLDFDVGLYTFDAGSELLDHLGGVHALAWTAINHHDFLHISMWK
jgi:hypothetical protein